MSFPKDMSGKFTAERVQPLKAKNEEEACPIYPLLEITAAFAGISEEGLLDEERFCGYRSVKDDSFDAPLAIYRHIQVKMCREISEMLESRISLVEDALDIGDILSFEQISQIPTSQDEKFKIAGQMKDKKSMREKSEEILEQWRDILFSLIGETESEEYDFAGVTKEELTDEFVLQKVKRYAKALDRYKGDEQSWLSLTEGYPF